jgi:hypothetical protein
LLATLLLIVAVWQTLPTGPILLFCTIVGLILGWILSMYRRPSRLAAAAEADRQLRFDDLLTSAVFPSNRIDADFHAIVQSMANARCQRHSPSEVLLRQLGIRSWSAVALAMSVAITLAVIPFNSSRSQAIDANASVLSAAQSDNTTTSHAAPGFTAVVNDPMSENSNRTSNSTETKTDATPADAAGSQSPDNSQQGNTAGVGGGSASRNTTPHQDVQSPNTSGRTPSPNGTSANGGAASHNQNTGGDTTTGSAGSSQSNGKTPAWTGGTNPTPAAPGSSTTDRTPPEYRDLMRDFFQR